MRHWKTSPLNQNQVTIYLVLPITIFKGASFSFIENYYHRFSLSLDFLMTFTDQRLGRENWLGLVFFFSCLCSWFYSVFFFFNKSCSVDFQSVIFLRLLVYDRAEISEMRVDVPVRAERETRRLSGINYQALLNERAITIHIGNCGYLLSPALSLLTALTEQSPVITELFRRKITPNHATRAPKKSSSRQIHVLCDFEISERQ